MTCVQLRLAGRGRSRVWGWVLPIGRVCAEALRRGCVVADGWVARPRAVGSATRGPDAMIQQASMGRTAQGRSVADDLLGRGLRGRCRIRGSSVAGGAQQGFFTSPHPNRGTASQDILLLRRPRAYRLGVAVWQCGLSRGMVQGASPVRMWWVASLTEKPLLGTACRKACGASWTEGGSKDTRDVALQFVL